MKKDSFRHVLSLLLFGSNGVVASHIALSACEIVFLRTFIGTFVLGAVFFGTGHRFSLRGAKADLAAILLSGAAMGAGWMLLYEAYARVGVSMASLLYYCGPVVVVALAPVFFGERIGKGTLLGFAAVLAGIFLVNGGSGSVRPDRTGVVCGILSAGCYAVMVIANKKAARIRGLENTLLQLFTAFLTVGGFIAVRGGYSFAIPAGSWGWVLLLGAVNTGFGCYLYFSSIGSLRAQTVAVCGYLEPLSAMLFAALFLHEVLTFPQWIGALLILGGNAWAAMRPNQPLAAANQLSVANQRSVDCHATRSKLG